MSQTDWVFSLSIGARVPLRLTAAYENLTLSRLETLLN